MNSLHLIWYIFQYEETINKVFMVNNSLVEDTGISSLEAIKNLSAYFDVEMKWKMVHNSVENQLFISPLNN